MINLPNVAFDKEKTMICGDIHSNLNNLIKLLDNGNVLSSTYKISLGDVVGYGENPNECIEIIDYLFDIGIKGNHDKGILSKKLNRFNNNAKSILEEQILSITKENKKKIKKYIPQVKRDNIMLFHGSPKSNFEYLNSESKVLKIFEENPDVDLFIGGHLHYPTISSFDKFSKKFEDNKDITQLVNNEHKLDLKLKKYYISIPSLSEGRRGFTYPGYLILKNLSKEIKKISFNFITN